MIPTLTISGPMYAVGGPCARDGGTKARHVRTLILQPLRDLANLRRWRGACGGQRRLGTCRDRGGGIQQRWGDGLQLAHELFPARPDLRHRDRVGPESLPSWNGSVDADQPPRRSDQRPARVPTEDRSVGADRVVVLPLAGFGL